jgi:predicted dehydrogenase/nucleoside-diphosphate-sugar epimerase
MLRIALIGAGHMAGRHLDALRRVATPHQVVGVCDLRAEAAQELAQHARTNAYTSVTELLDDARPDLVHVCTHPATHFALARQALLAGAHVYIEKPFAETRADAEALFELAASRGLHLCAGHQLLRDPAFRTLLDRATALQPLVLVDSYFAFRPPFLHLQRSAPRALGEQLLDVLPHPLYSLVAALEQLVPHGTPKLVHVSATATDLYALLRAGNATGRLCVSLRARPVASLLTVSGAHGSLTTDFVRGMVIGAGNDGTSPLEKIANPFVEASQLAWRSFLGLSRRLLRGVDYPGLAELLGDFYAAVAAGGRSPVSVDHLRRVTDIYEELAAQVHSASAAIPHIRRLVSLSSTPPTSIAESQQAPVAVVTGAGGFLGRAVIRELARRGFAVRGVFRSQPRDDHHVHEWVRADLAKEIPPEVFAGATVVVHAAAATAGGFDAHQRDSVNATRAVVRAMASAGVRQLVYVSSISVLEPPRSFRERQDEATPLAANAQRLGPYTWGKCAAEEIVAAAHAGGEVSARIIRPAALIDWDDIEVPGLVGRRLFGHWHLGFGRASLPFAACEVGKAGAAIAWIAERFADAPDVVNLMDPAITTRRHLLELFRKRGWRGRFIWVPIGLLAGTVAALGRAMALARRKPAPALSVWSVLRPRRYDPTVSAHVLAAALEDRRVPAFQATETPAPAQVSQAYG